MPIILLINYVINIFSESKMYRYIFFIICLLLIGISLAHSQNSPTYLEQMGVTYTAVSTQTLAYNVTAIAQNSSDGFGPAYILAGEASNGYWYEIGLSYNWPYSSSSGSYNGFALSYSAFDPNGSTSYPPGSGLLSFSRPIYNGDKVLLEMSFQNSKLLMYVKDWNTNATSSLTFNASGNYFVGTRYAGNSRGLFTGLMTEWYHTNPVLTYTPQEIVTYTPVGYNPPREVYLWADEYCTVTCGYNTQSNGFYYADTVFDLNSTLIYSNSSFNFTPLFNQYGVRSEFYSNGTFVTGSLKPVITTSISTSTSTSTSTSSTVSTLINTSTSTTIVTTTIQTIKQNTSSQQQSQESNSIVVSSSKPNNDNGELIAGFIIIVIVALLIYYVKFGKKVTSKAKNRRDEYMATEKMVSIAEQHRRTRKNGTVKPDKHQWTPVLNLGMTIMYECSDCHKRKIVPKGLNPNLDGEYVKSDKGG